jgi:hypothetical protein
MHAHLAHITLRTQKPCEILQNIFFVSLCFVFRETKKTDEIEKPMSAEIRQVLNRKERHDMARGGRQDRTFKEGGQNFYSMGRTFMVNLKK